MTTINWLGDSPYNLIASLTSPPPETPPAPSALDQALSPHRHSAYDLPLQNEAGVQNFENDAANKTSTLESTDVNKTSEGQTHPRKVITITLHFEDNSFEGVATVSVDHPHRKDKKKEAIDQKRRSKRQRTASVLLSGGQFKPHDKTFARLSRNSVSKEKKVIHDQLAVKNVSQSPSEPKRRDVRVMEDQYDGFNPSDLFKHTDARNCFKLEPISLPTTGALFIDKDDPCPSGLEQCLSLFFTSIQDDEERVRIEGLVPEIEKDFDPVFKQRFGIETTVRYISTMEVHPDCVDKIKSCWSAFIEKFNIKDTKKHRLYIDCITKSRPDGNDAWARKYEVKKVSEEVGYGLFAKKGYQKGEVVGFYAGRFVLKASLEGKDKSYVFDGFEHPFEDLAIDSIEGGNATRYMNHANNAKANVDTVEFYHTCFLYIMFEAKCKISPGREMRYNYGYDYWEAKGLDPTTRY